MPQESFSTASGAEKMQPVARYTLVLISTVIYFGLAVLGWGGWGAMFSHPALVALGWVFVGIVVVSCFAGGSLSTGVREDRSNRWVLWAMILMGTFNGWLPAFTDRHEIWTLDGDMVRWIGVALFALGGALRIWPVFVLGHRFSGLVAIQPGHQLVTDGVYHFIRHPSYLGLLVNSLGWSLAFRSGPGILLTLLLLVPLVARMNSEERLLRSQFGGEYAEFCARTSRLIPGIY